MNEAEKAQAIRKKYEEKMDEASMIFSEALDGNKKLKDFPAVFLIEYMSSYCESKHKNINKRNKEKLKDEVIKIVEKSDDKFESLFLMLRLCSESITSMIISLEV